MQARNCLAEPDRLSTEMNIINWMDVRVRHVGVKPFPPQADGWHRVAQKLRCRLHGPIQTVKTLTLLDCASDQNECHDLILNRNPGPCLQGDVSSAALLTEVPVPYLFTHQGFEHL
jgi:hypothetical protein